MLVTHDLPVVAQVCDRAAVMYAGEIVELGPMDALYHAPQHPYTRMLFAATPDLYGEGQVASIPGTPPRLDRDIIGCPFRPAATRPSRRATAEHPELRHGRSRTTQAACHLTRQLAGEGSAA